MYRFKLGEDLRNFPASRSTVFVHQTAEETAQVKLVGSSKKGATTLTKGFALSEVLKEVAPKEVSLRREFIS